MNKHYIIATICAILLIVISIIGCTQVDTSRYSFREFGSIPELRNWLSMDDTDKHPYEENGYDCDDFAIALCDSAREDGYKIYTFIMETHALCITKISDMWYMIEPQTDVINKWGKEL